MKGSIIAFDPCPHCENHDMCSKCELTFRRSGVIANPCEWISVEERLPQVSSKYICALKDKRGNIWTVPADWSLEMKTWFGEFGELKNIVTHWMPLPEAPKGGAE